MSENKDYCERFRLHSMPYAQCHIRIFQNEHDYLEVQLISYETLVCKAILTYGELSLQCTGTYSTTTARHINRFTNEFFGRNLYYLCKKQAGKGLVMSTTNIEDIMRFENCVRNYKYDTFGYGQVYKYFGRY